MPMQHFLETKFATLRNTLDFHGMLLLANSVMLIYLVIKGFR